MIIQPLKKPVIVLVEDDQSLRFLFGLILEDAGFAVVKFSNISIAQSEFPNDAALLLTDNDLPEVGQGVELANWSSVNYPSLPVVLMSGRPLGDRKPHSVSVFLEKSFDNNTLVEVVRSLLLRVK